MTTATATMSFAPSARRASRRSATSRIGVLNLALAVLAAALFAGYVASYVGLYRSAIARDRAETRAATAASEVRALEGKVMAAGKTLDEGSAASLGLVEVAPRYVSVAPVAPVVGLNVR